MRALTSERIRELRYAPMLAFAMSLMMLRTVVMARLFNLTSFAQFSAGLLVSSTFCMLVCLGLQSILQRSMPMMIVRGRVRAGAVLVAQCIIVACMCALVCIAASLFLSSYEVIAFTIPLNILLVGIVHGLSQQLFLIVTVESRSRMQAQRFAKQNLARGIAILLMGVVIAIITQSSVWTLAVEAIVSLILIQGTLCSIFKTASIQYWSVFRLAYRRLAGISWRSAIMLLLVSIASFILYNADRWIAAKALTLEQFGLYAFAGISLTIAGALQVLINSSVYPMLARRYALDGPVSSYRICARISLALLLIGSLFVVPTWLFADWAVTHFFPHYEEAKILLPIFFIVAALRISNFWASFMIISGHESQLLAINLISFGLAGFLWLIWIEIWPGNNISLNNIAIFSLLLTVSSYILAASLSKRMIKC